MGKHTLSSLVKQFGLACAIAGAFEARAADRHGIWERGAVSGILSAERCRPLQKIVDSILEETPDFQNMPVFVEEQCSSFGAGLFDIGAIGPPAKKMDIGAIGPPARKMDIGAIGPPAKKMDIGAIGPPAKSAGIGAIGPPAFKRAVAGLMQPSKKKPCPVEMYPQAPSALSGVHIVWTDDENKKWTKSSDFPWVALKKDGDKIYIEGSNCHFSVAAKRR